MVKSSGHRGLIDLRLALGLRARRPILIAHRGGIVGPNAPENSTNAMRHAHARRYDMVELDVVAARDDEPVLFHDGSLNLRRLCGVDVSVRDLSPAELSQIRYRASDQSILSLADALCLCRELQLGVMLDLKAPSPSARWLDRIAALLRESGLVHAAMTISLHPLAREHLGPLVMQRIDRETVRRVMDGEDVSLAGRFWFGLPEDLPEALVGLLHARGALAIPAINTFRYPPHAHQKLAREDINRLLASGVDGFQIDGVYGTYLGVGE